MPWSRASRREEAGQPVYCLIFTHHLLKQTLKSPWRKKTHTEAFAPITVAQDGLQSLPWASPAPGKCLARHCPLLVITIISTTHSLVQGGAGSLAPVPALYFFLTSHDVKAPPDVQICLWRYCLISSLCQEFRPRPDRGSLQQTWILQPAEVWTWLVLSLSSHILIRILHPHPNSIFKKYF